MDSLENLASFRLRVGRIAGIEIFVHWTLILLSLYSLYTFRTDPKLGLLVLMGLWGSILLHELGHCWGARRVGGEANEVLLWPLGGLAMLHTPLAPWPVFFSTLTGPLVNVLLVVLCLPVFLALGGDVGWLLPSGGYPLGASLGLKFVFYMVWLNGWMMLFNVIPAYPLDGGRMFHCALWPRLGFVRAMHYTLLAAFGCATLLAVYALWQRNGMLLAIVGFIVFGALRERENLRYGAYDEELLEQAPWAASLAEADDDEPARARQPSRFARWLERRRRRREEEERRRREELRERLDQVLAKVSAEGMDSLTRDERRFLERASQELRKEQSPGK